MTLQAKIIAINKEVTEFLDHEKQYSSSKFLKLISVLKNIGKVNEDMNDEEELK
jgi:hypothetical protein